MAIREEQERMMSHSISKKMFFYKKENKSWSIQPFSITSYCDPLTSFLVQRWLICLAAKIMNSGTHWPVVLPQPITVIYCFFPDVWYWAFFCPLLAMTFGGCSSNGTHVLSSSLKIFSPQQVNCCYFYILSQVIVVFSDHFPTVLFCVPVP